MDEPNTLTVQLWRVVAEPDGFYIERPLWAGKERSALPYKRAEAAHILCEELNIVLRQNLDRAIDMATATAKKFI